MSTFAGRLSGAIVAIGTNGSGNVDLDVRDPLCTLGTLQTNALGAPVRRSFGGGGSRRAAQLA